MTEQSQMPLVGPPMRRGWREIARFRPLTSSTHAALVVTRRGRLVSILPAGGPRVLSDYLAWPYDFREVDTRERLLMLEQRVESFDSTYEFSVVLRLIYQVVRPDRVALDLEDVASELSHAVVQSLRLSGRSFGVEQDKTFEEHLQETLLTSDALVQRVLQLGLELRRADVAVSLDEPTRVHAEALRFAMRERPLHFQVAVDTLEPDRRFDVIVGGAYRLIDRRVHDGPSDTTDSAIQQAITNALRRVGITFSPSDYLDAAKTMADVLRKDALLQSELSMVQAHLLRPTVQIQPDRSMVHVPRPSMLGAPDSRPSPMLRRARQNLPRMGRPPALIDSQERTQKLPPTPDVHRALPPPAAITSRRVVPPAQPSADSAASPTLPLGDLPGPSDPIEDAYTFWPLPEALPAIHARPVLGQPDDTRDDRAPWADLINKIRDQDADPWSDTPPPTASAAPSLGHLAAEPQLWDALDREPAQPQPEDPAPLWMADQPTLASAAPSPSTPPLPSAIPEPVAGSGFLTASAEIPPSEPQPEEPAPEWTTALPAIENDLVESQTEEQISPWLTAPPAIESEQVEPQPWDALVLDAAEPPLVEEHASPWLAAPSVTESAVEEPQPWDALVLDAAEPPLVEEHTSPWLVAPSANESAVEEPQPWDALVLDSIEPPLVEEHASPWLVAPSANESAVEELQPWDALVLDSIEPPLVEEHASPWLAAPSANENAVEELQPWEPSSITEAAPLDTGAALATKEPWSVPDIIAEVEAAADPPSLSKSDPNEDLGFSLDWSAPEIAEPVAELPASAPMTATPVDDLGFSLDWSDPQPDSYASAWAPSADTTTDHQSIAGHWGDPAAADTPVADATASFEPAQPDLEDAHPADQAAAIEQGAEQDEAPIIVEQESSPWYAPMLQLDDPVPVDPDADNNGYAPFETFKAPWAEPQDAPIAPAYEQAADATITPLPEVVETPEMVWAEPAEPDYEQAANTFSPLPNEAADEQSSTTNEPARDLVSDSVSEPAQATAASAPEIPAEQIARIIGMIQSYGPAWFKMWSLELKERPERLPVVLGEVTADPILLAQAADPRTQSALLAALAAYTAPVAFPARLPMAAPLPSPAIAGQGRESEDEVPDWLSLRVKWNGHGGGA